MRNMFTMEELSYAQRWGKVVTTLSTVRSDTTLLQLCHNIEDEWYIPTLLQCCNNVGITLKQRYHNVGKLHIWCCHNIATMVKRTLYHNIHTMFRQRCVNVVWTLVLNLEIWPDYSNVVTTLWQLWKLCNFQCCHNTAAMFPERCERCGLTKDPSSPHKNVPSRYFSSCP